MIPWILISVAILLILLAIGIVLIRKKKPSPPDYYAFFVIGVIWTITGAISMFYRGSDLTFLFIMGLVFFSIGITNKDKWKKNRFKWKKLSKKEKKLHVILISILSILLLLGIVAFFLIRWSIL